jgi:hypothetical protein
MAFIFACSRRPVKVMARAPPIASAVVDGPLHLVRLGESGGGEEVELVGQDGVAGGDLHEALVGPLAVDLGEVDHHGVIPFRQSLDVGGERRRVDLLGKGAVARVSGDGYPGRQLEMGEGAGNGEALAAGRRGGLVGESQGGKGKQDG